ncbi:transcriptional repressor CTCF isoform X2 [Musca domestica]|nr:transcriptional repressor CTCF isoform X2 [Musca domestica]XP_019892968.1 transcriptional repressor CTCF isoform X2 [Musca domestica]
MADDNSDLESYLDELEKHVEEDITAIYSEVANEEEEKQQEEDDVEDDDALDDAELEDGTIFMDEEGNYYYQSGKKAVQVKPVKKEKSIVKSVAAAVKKRKLSQSPQRPVKKEKLNTSKESPKPPSPTKSTKTNSRNKNAGNNSILKYLDIQKKPKETKAETPASPEKTKTTARKQTAVKKATISPRATTVRTRGRKATELNVTTKTEPADTTDANITATTVDQTIASEVSEANGEVYDFDETERTVNGADFTVDESKEEGVIESEVLLKPLHITPDSEGQFKCQICDYSTNKKFLLTRHFRTHSDDRPYKCSVCERGFKTHNSLMNHINTHLGNKPYKCGDCEMSFTTSGELTRHRRYRHTLVKPHKCTECDYSSVELSKLRRHMRCHTGERPYQCPHCTYASPDTFKLKRHMRTHTGEKPYECDICHARFTQSNSLKYHRLIHSVNDKPVFQCNLCPTTCGRKTDLRLHIQKLHNSETPFPCKRCGKELPDRYQYKMHVKTHEGEKCYRCTYCPYASISQRLLDTHMLIHTDTKPFVCDLCQQSFRQKQLLARHMKLYHTANYEPPKPLKKGHVCPHCERAFAFKGNLMRHMETHDPNSKINEEKLKIKMGRLKRVQPDGTVVTQIKSSFIYNEDEVVNATNEREMSADNQENVIFEDENGEPVQYVYEDYEPEEEEPEEEEEYDENYQELEYYEEEDEKPQFVIKTEKCNREFTTIDLPAELNVKKEKESVVATEDDEYMIIEVMQDAEEVDLEGQQEFCQNSPEKQPKITKPAPSVISKSKTSALKAITEDCFGFDDDVESDDEVAENTEHTETSELIEILKE